MTDVSKTPTDSDYLVEKLKKEVRERRKLQIELAQALKKQEALNAEIQMLQTLLNARSVPDFVMYKAWTRVEDRIGTQPRKLSKKVIKKARRTAGAVKRRILP